MACRIVARAAPEVARAHEPGLEVAPREFEPFSQRQRYWLRQGEAMGVIEQYALGHRVRKEELTDAELLIDLSDTMGDNRHRDAPANPLRSVGNLAPEKV